MQEVEQAQARYSGAPSESIQSSTLASSQDINGKTKAAATAATSTAAKRRGGGRGTGGLMDLAAGGPSSLGPSAKSCWPCGRCCGHVWSTVADCLRAGPAARRRRYDGMRPLGGGGGGITAGGAAGQINSVSQIDSVSRFLFPFAFVALNILYWAGFLYYF